MLRPLNGAAEQHLDRHLRPHRAERARARRLCGEPDARFVERRRCNQIGFVQDDQIRLGQLAIDGVAHIAVGCALAQRFGIGEDDDAVERVFDQ